MNATERLDNSRRPHSLDVLLACLVRLRDRNIAWTRLAEAHYRDLLSGRFEAMEKSVALMEQELLAIGEEEDLRIRSTLELADDLGMPDDPPPRLADIAAQLPPDWAADLASRGRELRDTLAVAEEAGKRSSGMAKIGLQVSQGAIRLAQEAAVRSVRKPAAYQRGGQKTTGTAVPVFQRAWKA